VRISSNDGIVVEEAFVIEDNTGKIFEIYLMDNTRSRRNDLEVVESLRTPFQELESFSVTIEFDDLVLFGGISSTEYVSLNGVINDEIYGAKRVDLGRITS
jgi:hypothetical protein